MAFPDELEHPTRNPILWIHGSARVSDQLQPSLRTWPNHTFERVWTASKNTTNQPTPLQHQSKKNRDHNAPYCRFVELNFDLLTCRWLDIERGEGTRYVEE